MQTYTAFLNLLQKRFFITCVVIVGVVVSISAVLVPKADALGTPIVKSAVGGSFTYDFTNDTIGSVPLGMTVATGTFSVANQAVLGKAMHATNTGGDNAIILDQFASSSDYSVTWKDAYDTTGRRQGFVLRTQAIDSAVPGIKRGYLFQVNHGGASGSPNMMRIYRYDASFAILQSTALTSVSPRWYKAMVKGNSLGFYYSNDGVNFILVTASSTDSVYASGGVQYQTGSGTKVDGDAYVDDINQTLFSGTVADTIAPLISSVASTTASTTANVTWTTDENSTSKVAYGLSSGLYPSSVSNGSLVLSHSLNLSGLTAGTLYYYVVVSADASGNIATSTQRTFVTAPSGIGSVNLATPKPFQVFQRNAGNQGNIAISGSYTGSPTAIEASWNGSAYATIATNPTGGTFSGTLANKPAGQGTLSVRFANNTAISNFVSNVGIGDIFVIAGQSNASGRGFTNNVYTHPTLKATMFGNNDVWQNLTDPTDSSVGQVDAVSDDLGKAAGSPYPLIATYFLADQNVPVAFIPASMGGTAIGLWARDLSPTTLYGSMYRRINAAGGAIKGVLWFQGESDADHGIGATATESNYLSSLVALGNSVFADFGAKLISGQIAYSGAPPHVDFMDDVRQAQISAWNLNGNVLPGPAFPDVNLSDEGGDTIHFKSDLDMQLFAARWWASLKADYYGGTDGRGPRLVSANWGNSPSQMVLTFTDETLPIFQTSNIGGFTVTDSLGQKTILSSTRTANNQITLALSSPAVGATTVSLATLNTGIGVNMPTDSSSNHLPAEIFENRTVVDGTNPTVSLTAPLTGSTVSTTTLVSANASDNIGVAGVQFTLDGVSLGAEDTVSPYSVSWNTASSTNGAHTLAALVRDGAGNIATSTNVFVVVINNAQPVQNLVVDPGFENSTSPWNKANFEFHSGTASFPVVVSSATTRGSYQSLNVTAGSIYDVSGWIKTNGVGGPGADIRLVWLNNVGTTVGTNSVSPLTGTQNWTQIESNVTAPAGAVSVRINLETGIDPDNAGVAWFDDIVFGVIQ